MSLGEGRCRSGARARPELDGAAEYQLGSAMVFGGFPEQTSHRDRCLQMVAAVGFPSHLRSLRGYGGRVLPIYDELFQQEKVKHILVRQERHSASQLLVRASVERQDRMKFGRRHRERQANWVVPMITPNAAGARAETRLSRRTPPSWSSALWRLKVTLEALGWSSRRQQEFEAHAAEGLVPGRVVGEHRSHYRVATEVTELTAGTTGRLRNTAEERSDLPGVGDFVAMRLAEGDGPATIEAVLPRTSALVRKAAANLARNSWRPISMSSSS